MFPTIALAEWLANRRCEINLCHPVMKIESIAHMGCPRAASDIVML